MTCAIKDHNKFYLQLFLEHALYAKVCKKDIRKESMPAV